MPATGCEHNFDISPSHDDGEFVRKQHIQYIDTSSTYGATFAFIWRHVSCHLVKVFQPCFWSPPSPEKKNLALQLLNAPFTASH